MLRSSDDLDFWVDFMSHEITPFRLEPAGDLPFHLDMDVRKVGGFMVVGAGARGCRMARTSAEIARSPSQFYTVAVAVDGASRLAIRGEERLLTPGDLFVIDTQHAYAFGFERPIRHVFANLSRAWIDARMTHPERLAGSVLPHGRPLARLLRGYLAAGFQTAKELPPPVATLFAQHLADLVTEAFAEPPGKPLPPESWRAAIFVRACRVIALKFGDPSLAPDQIAMELGISTRTLRRIFATHGRAVMGQVLEYRINHAAKLLASPQSIDRSITEIAFSCGFNDISHFGRVFAERMHMTPSAWRKQHH